MYNESLIGTLSLIMIATSVSAVEARNLRVSAFAYAAQALLICGLILAFAVGSRNVALYGWAAVAFGTKVVLTPWLLFAYVRRTTDREVRAIIGFGPSVIIAVLILVSFYKLTHTYADFMAPTTAAMHGVFRTNLAVALTVFVIGIYAILSRRDAIKTVVGLCLLENAVHLSLVSLAPGIRETALIGIATEVVLTVWLLLYIISAIHQKFGSTDTFKLSELHW
ncbi:MAG: NADH-quinone oxidoreductase subunit K [Armatimonadota bacterium]|nr:MAG: NADH-quinone oxidoreductase subunit K [Armatimonadota bacterium]